MPQFRFLFSSSNYDDTVGFYTDTLGLPVVHSWDEPERGTIVAAAGSAQVEILESAVPVPITGVALGWEVDDIDALHAELVGKGVTFHAPPTDQPWGHRSATLKAPENLDITLFMVIGDES